MKKQPTVYLLTNKPGGTLYTGVTSDLPRRMWQHRNKAMKGFSARYNLNRLVYFEFLMAITTIPVYLCSELGGHRKTVALSHFSVQAVAPVTKRRPSRCELRGPSFFVR